MAEEIDADPDDYCDEVSQLGTRALWALIERNGGLVTIPRGETIPIRGFIEIDETLDGDIVARVRRRDFDA